MQIKDMMTFEVNGKKCVALVRKWREYPLPYKIPTL